MSKKNRDIIEKIANKFAKNGYKSILVPTSTGMFNYYIDQCHSNILRIFFKEISQFRSNSTFPIIEIGCGVGRWSNRLAKKTNVVSIDFLITHVREALRRSRILQLNSKISYLVASANKLPFKNNSFEHGLSVITLQHITSKKQLSEAINELKRVSNRIAILEGTSDFPLIHLKPFLYPTRLLRSSDFIDMFEKGSEMRLSKISGVVFMPVWYIVSMIEHIKIEDRYFRFVLFSITKILTSINLILRKYFWKYSYHKLMIFDKIKDEKTV